MKPKSWKAQSSRVWLTTLFGLIVLLGSLLVPAGLGQALPPGGPGPNTPGTSSEISPKTVRPGDRISFKVHGYPAGETVHVKIDDGRGQGYDTSKQGTGVVATAPIGSDGSASGSVQIPASLSNGQHWLRFLASSWVDPNNKSKGTKGYTHKSEYFTVTDSTGHAGVTDGGTQETTGPSVAASADVAQAGPAQSEGVTAELGKGTPNSSGVVELKQKLSDSMTDGQYTIRVTQESTEAEAYLAVGNAQLPQAKPKAGGATVQINGKSVAAAKAGEQIDLKASGFKAGKEATFTLLRGVSGQNKTVVQEEGGASVSPWVIGLFVGAIVIGAIGLFLMLRASRKAKKMQSDQIADLIALAKAKNDEANVDDSEKQ